MTDENGLPIERMVRVGRVTAVDAAKKQVRALFEDSGTTSGWLYVLQRGGGGLAIKPDGGHKHTISDTYTGGGSAGVQPDHVHAASVTAVWLPKINDLALVLYLPLFNGDGFVLGVIG